MKVEMRNRELLEAEEAIRKMDELEVGQKLGFAINKNMRIIGDAVQDLRKAIQMKEDKFRMVSEYNEKKKIAMQDASIKDKAKFLEELREEYPDCEHAVELHNRETAETLMENMEIDLHAMKAEWFPKKFKVGMLGPLVAVVTGIDDEDDG